MVARMPEVVLLTTTEVAKRFRVDTSVVRRWVTSGNSSQPSPLQAGTYRFDESSLAVFINAEGFAR